MMTAVDLFCGGGGLSLGFLNAGISILAGVDNWEEALDVYRQNFQHPAIKCDLSDVATAVQRISTFAPDMIIGGPPCQDFSSAGKRNEENGRGDLTISYAMIVSAVKPTWFVMENVARITRTQKLQAATTIFRKAEYGLTCAILDTSLCGVPQKRKRFVMIGKLGECDDFIYTTLTRRCDIRPMTVREYMGDKIDIQYYYRHPRSYVRRGIFSVNEPSPTIRGVNRPLPQGYRLHPGDPVTSLDGIRPLTTRERSMIQTFPEDFIFTGTKTNIEQIIGNAVPVNLGTFIAKAILEYEHNNQTTTPILHEIYTQRREEI